MTEVKMFYWFDHKTENATDPTPSSEVLTDLVEKTGASHVSGPESLLAAGPCVCFVHGGTDQLSWEGIASSDNKRFIVLLSFGGTAGAITKGNTAIKSVETERLRMAIRHLNVGDVRRFEKSINDGNPDWSIIEWRLETSYSVAWYLLRAYEVESANHTNTAPDNKVLIEYNKWAKQNKKEQKQALNDMSIQDVRNMLTMLG
ncbi:MAG: hypothetical protein ACT4PZ_11260 [Panacagrimonas sp.]